MEANEIIALVAAAAAGISALASVVVAVTANKREMRTHFRQNEMERLNKLSQVLSQFMAEDFRVRQSKSEDSSELANLYGQLRLIVGMSYHKNISEEFLGVIADRNPSEEIIERVYPLAIKYMNAELNRIGRSEPAVVSDGRL